jgi:2'-5' RNA ligase
VVAVINVAVHFYSPEPELVTAARKGKQRLFFALWPDATLREQIAAAAEPVLAELQPHAVPVQNYHLTIAFLGAVSVATVPDVAAAARGIRFAPFELVLQQGGYWQRSCTAWLAPVSCPQALAALVGDLSNKLTDLGLALDNQQFRPHVTLARNAGAAASVQLATPVRWRVQSFVLLESTPGAAGPVYTVLEEFPAAQ